jgi:hypothetical protein
MAIVPAVVEEDGLAVYPDVPDNGVPQFGQKLPVACASQFGQKAIIVPSL